MPSSNIVLAAVGSMLIGGLVWWLRRDKPADQGSVDTAPDRRPRVVPPSQALTPSPSTPHNPAASRVDWGGGPLSRAPNIEELTQRYQTALRTFHPDRVTDPDERESRTALCGRLTDAFQNNQWGPLGELLDGLPATDA